MDQIFMHLGNCHGEWTMVFGGLLAIPFFGKWFAHKLHCRLHKHAQKDCPHDHTP